MWKRALSTTTPLSDDPSSRSVPRRARNSAHERDPKSRPSNGAINIRPAPAPSIAERTDPVSQIATHRTRQKTLSRGTSSRASTGEDGGEGDSPGREEHVERMKGPSTRCRSVRFRARAALYFETETLPPPHRPTRHAGRDSGSEDGAALRYAHLAVSSPQSRRSECRPPRPPSARASARGHRGAPRRR